MNKDCMPMMNLSRLLKTAALLPVLRGITPDSILAISHVLVDAGFLCIEVTLNSPAPYESIARLVKRYNSHILIAAGTVFKPDQVQQAVAQGAQLIVTPHSAVDIIQIAKRFNVACVAGFSTPTEAFQAIQAGADALKFFPATAYSPNTLAAIKSVLPAIPIIPTGGIDVNNMAAYLKAGAAGFGFGGQLYKPGFTADEVEQRARPIVDKAYELGLVIS